MDYEKRWVVNVHVSRCMHVLSVCQYTHQHANMNVAYLVRGSGKVAIEVAMDLAPRVAHEAHHTDHCISTRQC